MWDYSEKVKDLYINPKNSGKIEDADVVAEVGSMVCGDALKLYLKIDDNNVITDAKFETFGCGSAIASSSALTEMIIGKTIEEVEKIKNEDIVRYLGGLPDAKIHCSVMGNEALEKAIAKWRGEDITEEEELAGEKICQCFDITDALIKKVVRENDYRYVEQVTAAINAGGACGSCIPRIEDIIGEELKIKNQSNISAENDSISSFRRMQVIQETIDNNIRPLIRSDGGDLDLVDIVDSTVYVRLKGSCSNCIAADNTLKNIVEKKLRDMVDASLVVEHVK